MKHLVSQLDKLVSINAPLINTIRVAALISANWEEVRKALLAWDGKECSKMEQKETNNELD